MEINEEEMDQPTPKKREQLQMWMEKERKQTG
jgi:hypothetical protein